MGVRVRDLLGRRLGELRFEPTAKRLRGMLDSQTLFESRKALLVWEPRRVLPTYAVPVGDIAGSWCRRPPLRLRRAPRPGSNFPTSPRALRC